MGILKFSAYLPSFSLNGNQYQAGSIYADQKLDSLALLAQITKQFENNDVKLLLNTHARNNIVTSQLEWASLQNTNTKGLLRTRTSFLSDEEDKLHTEINILPSTIHVGDTIWKVDEVKIKNQQYEIQNFRIGHENQYVMVNTFPKNQGSSFGIIAKLNDIDLAYVFNILDFHPVEFAGKASGIISSSKDENDPSIHANIEVPDFRFNEGRMGRLKLLAKYNTNDQIINLNAKTSLTETDSLLINGQVNIDKDSIDIHFHSAHTPLDFLDHYLSGIFHPLKGHTSGNLRLFGPLSGMNLDGKQQIDDLALSPRVLNTTYYITNDSVFFVPGQIQFRNLSLRDAQGNGHVNGCVTHKELSDFGFDILINTANLLCFDWNERETNTFWGSVRTNGQCRLHGTTDQVTVDLEVTPTSGSSFVYDSSTPGENDTKEFIRFTSARDVLNKAHQQKDKLQQNKKKEESLINRDNATDIYLNLKVNTTPDATLVVLTDAKTRDHISLNGSGPLHINYYNKGKFSMFGTYTLTGGQYNITIQDIIHKNFTMQPGGTIRFNGPPLEGDINMKGIYTINSVSLGDLNLGNLSQSSTANVDCILNFKGNAGAPEVSFDLDFPNVNSEERQMVRNMISSQGDINMQIIYLLSIGRFFTYDYANSGIGAGQNQSTMAMQSLLASTLSEQFNTMLQNALHVNNWKFGTNISTGRYGWNDMEVEGLLSGSLLNNRVLINGNFGYRDQPTYSNNFVGDFNVRWLLTKNGVISLKAYSQTNDRYFTKTSLTTNGVGILFQRDFNAIGNFFRQKKKLTAY